MVGSAAEANSDVVLATVMFAELVQPIRLGDVRWHELIDRHDDLVRAAVGRFGGRTLASPATAVPNGMGGGGFFCVFDEPAAALDCAEALHRAVADRGLQTRAGIHTGECVVREQTLGGMTVSVGARICALAEPGEVLVSTTVRELAAGSGFQFEQRGEHVLKGVPGRWTLYEAVQQEAEAAAYLSEAVSHAERYPRSLALRRWLITASAALAVVAVAVAAGWLINLPGDGSGAGAGSDGNDQAAIEASAVKVDSLPLPTVRWNADVGGYIRGRAVVAGEHVLVPTNAGLSVRARGDGADLGVYPFVVDEQIDPVLADSTLLLVTEEGRLLAIDPATGVQRWQSGPARFVSSPTVYQGVVYIGGDDGSLYRFDLASGDELLKLAIGGQPVATPVVTDAQIVVGSAAGTLFALDRFNGDVEQWRADIGSAVGGVAVNSEVVYVTTAHQVYAFELGSGIELWRTELRAGGIGTVPAVGDGHVFIGTEAGMFYALDAATGQPRWSVTTTGEVDGSPVLADGQVVFGGNDKSIYAIDTLNGTGCWRFDVGHVVQEPVSIDGDLLFAVSGSRLYAVQRS